MYPGSVSLRRCSGRRQTAGPAQQITDRSGRSADEVTAGPELSLGSAVKDDRWVAQAEPGLRELSVVVRLSISRTRLTTRLTSGVGRRGPPASDRRRCAALPSQRHTISLAFDQDRALADGRVRPTLRDNLSTDLRSPQPPMGGGGAVIAR